MALTVRRERRSSACCSVFSFCKRSRACCRRRDRSPAMATLLWLSAARGKARRTSVLSAEICTQRRFWSLMLSSKSWRRKETIAARPASSESESSCSRQMWCSTNCWYVLGCGIIAQARSSNWCVSGSSAATCARSSSTWLTALTGLAALLPFRGWRSCCWRSSDRRGSSRTAGAGPMRSIVPLHYLHPQPFAEERDCSEISASATFWLSGLYVPLCTLACRGATFSVRTSGTLAACAVRRWSSASQVQAEDTFQPSGRHAELQRLTAQAASVPEVRTEKVAPLQAKVQRGTYKPDSQKVADALISEQSRSSAKG